MAQMRKFVVVGRTAAVHGGRVRLTPEQAKSRRHNLAPVEGQDGVFDVTGPLCFKHGEQFEHDGTFPKSMANEVVPAEVAAAAAAAKPAPAVPAATGRRRGGLLSRVLGGDQG